MIDHLKLRAWDYVVYPDELLREAHLKQAREMNAPEDAVFFDNIRNRWVTYSEVTNPLMIKWMQKALQNPEKLLLQSEK